MIKRLRVIWRILTAQQYFYLTVDKCGEVEYDYDIIKSLPKAAPSCEWFDLVANRRIQLQHECKKAFDRILRSGTFYPT